MDTARPCAHAPSRTDRRASVHRQFRARSIRPWSGSRAEGLIKAHGSDGEHDEDYALTRAGLGPREADRAPAGGPCRQTAPQSQRVATASVIRLSRRSAPGGGPDLLERWPPICGSPTRLRAARLTPEGARAEARRAFGGVEQTGAPSGCPVVDAAQRRGTGSAARSALLRRDPLLTFYRRALLAIVMVATRRSSPSPMRFSCSLLRRGWNPSLVDRQQPEGQGLARARIPTTLTFVMHHELAASTRIRDFLRR